MPQYSLIYADDGIGGPKQIEFDAHDAARALTIAHKEAQHRSAELWSEGAMLCTIKRVGASADIWMIGPAERRRPGRGSVEPSHPAVRVRGGAALNRDQLLA